jgi:hypothetical protein
MSTKSNTSASLLRGKTVRKNGVASGGNTVRQHVTQVPTTTGIVYGGGVKDPSGRTTEYFVSCIVLSMTNVIEGTFIIIIII